MEAIKTTKIEHKILKHFFVYFLLLNLPILIWGCSDDTLEENEEFRQLALDKDEKLDSDNKKYILLASDKDEEPDQDNRE